MWRLEVSAVVRHIYIYIYIYVCVCVCVCVLLGFKRLKEKQTEIFQETPFLHVNETSEPRITSHN